MAIKNDAVIKLRLVRDEDLREDDLPIIYSKGVIKDYVSVQEGLVHIPLGWGKIVPLRLTLPAARELRDALVDLDLGER